MSEWISVKDKLPEHYGNLLLLVNKYHPVIGYFRVSCKEWCNTEGEEITTGKITHWLQIPALPEN